MGRVGSGGGILLCLECRDSLRDGGNSGDINLDHERYQEVHPDLRRSVHYPRSYNNGGAACG